MQTPDSIPRTPRHGWLDTYWAQGEDTALPILVEAESWPAPPPYTLHVLAAGDHLTVYQADGSVQWAGELWMVRSWRQVLLFQPRTAWERKPPGLWDSWFDPLKKVRATLRPLRDTGRFYPAG